MSSLHPTPYTPHPTPSDFNLAIETSGRVGSFSLGRGDAIIETVELPPQTGGAGSGGSSELMFNLDALCRKHGVKPAQIGEVYLSIGPGSFTGLRVGVTIAKMFALTVGAKCIAVPTLDVVAQNAPSDAVHVAVGLNLKKESVYAGVFAKRDGRWRGVDEPGLRTMSELIERAPRPLMVIGDPLPALSEGVSDVMLRGDLARARSESLWLLGREAASGGRYVNPLELSPLYVRPPEAVELWDKRHGKPAATAV